MSKLGMAGAAMGVGGTGAAGIYGAHKMGWLGGGSSAELPKEEKNNEETQSNKYLIGKTKDEFIKASGKSNGGCLDGVFKDWTVQDNLTEPSTVSLDATPKETEGCLAFNWEKKKEGAEEPKENNLRFVWALSRGNTGFAVYVSGTVTDAEKDKIKVTFEGAAYVFKKNNDKWEVSNRLDLKKDSQTLEQTTDISGKFPKLAAAMKGKLEGLKEVEGDYWGFLDNDGQKLSASAEKTNYGYGKWTGKADGSEQLKDWSSNLDAWWSHFFDKSKWDMTNLVSDIQGTWSKE